MLVFVCRKTKEGKNMGLLLFMGDYVMKVSLTALGLRRLFRESNLNL